MIAKDLDLWRLGSPKICNPQTGVARELMLQVQLGKPGREVQLISKQDYGVVSSQHTGWPSNSSVKAQATEF